jgi:opacity protein-like surface antigen
MRLKPYFELAIALFFVCAADAAFTQTGPAATSTTFPWAIGAGFSDYNTSWGNGEMLGGALWIDYTLNRVPQRLRGIGLEVEALDISIATRSAHQKNFREDVASGGVIYSWPRYRNFRPYGKFLMGYGNDEYPISGARRYHQSRTVSTMGCGLEYRAYKNVWARVDYEYQVWPNFWKHTGEPAGQLTPEGFTFGAMYHFNTHPNR